MISLSSALRAAMATDYGLSRMMNMGCIRIFSGSPPASADEAETGDLLGMITQDGTPFMAGTTQGGLNLQPGPMVGACQASGNWVLNATKSGTAGWWRFVWNGLDNGSATEYTPRIDGRMGEGLWLGNKNLTAGDSQALSSFYFLIPPTQN